MHILSDSESENDKHSHIIPKFGYSLWYKNCSRWNNLEVGEFSGRPPIYTIFKDIAGITITNNRILQ